MKKLLAVLFLLLCAPVYAQAPRQNAFSTAAMREWGQCVTADGHFGACRLAADPTCTTAMEGRIWELTSTHLLRACLNGSATAVGSSGPSGTAASGQVALWSGVSTLAGDTGLTYSGTGATFVLTVGGSSNTGKLLGNSGIPQGILFGPFNGDLVIGPGPTSTTGMLYMQNGVGMSVRSGDIFGWTTSTSNPTTTIDTYLSRGGAATLQLGAANAASPVSQTLRAQGSRSGTDSNVAGGSLTIQPGPGTGTGAGTKVQVQRNLVTSTGSGAQATGPAETYCESKTLSNTTGTATAIANVAIAAGGGAGMKAVISVFCTNGTEHASSTVQTYQSAVNKAGTLTIGTATTQTESNAASTGATINCTVVPTWIAGTNSVDIKVTPVITGTATTTTAMIDVETFGAGAVTCN